MTMRIGASTTIITNALGTHIQGATVGGVAKYVRDELEANALYVEGGDDAVLLVSCDLGGLEPDFTDAARAAMAGTAHLDPRQIILGATHTGGPSVIPTNYSKPVDRKYLAMLHDKLVVLAGQAVSRAVPARVATNAGRAKIGYNRRCCFADGSHAMGLRGRDDLTGLEGPEDPEQFALFAQDSDGKLIAILHQNTSHPCTFYGADFYSADYPGYARKLLRESIRPDLPVLFFNGAFGDQGQDKQTPPVRRDTHEMKLARCGALLAGETLRLLYESAFEDDVVVRHLCHDLPVAIRLPDAKRLAWAAETLGRVDAGQDVPAFDVVFAHGSRLLHERFGQAPTESLPLHAVRIGRAAILTQPTELFCRFGLDIKSRSPFALTSVFSICDGYRGYCPTAEAIIGGGYSSEPIYWTRLAPEAGYQIVDKACTLLFELAQDGDRLPVDIA